ncbi:histidine phosphatase family protein [uncultured Fibrobacter sp.]|uniref:histidine phosphatase family protein n=1 Tax=uncultured Fibrobacter sp. TaxID=261512 RepID=UPI0025EA4B0B|nr:histidine phosphatase family protein [uncultured Fibrobacter sp.]
MHKISRISLALTGAILSASLLAACGDDSATSPISTAISQSSSSQIQQEQLSSSSTDQLPASSADITSSTDANSSSATAPIGESSSSVEIPPTQSSSSVGTAELDPSCVETPVADIPLDTNGLADIADVFKSVRCNEKAVFIIRHGERDDAQTGRETPLTYWENEPDSVNGQPSDGVRQARAVGKKLISADEFVYSHTNYVRTEQTCYNINLGRGQQTFQHDTTSLYSISWYKKDSERYKFYDDSTTNVRLVIAGWAYDNLYADAFYDLKEKSEEIIKKDIAPGYASMNKYRVICTHDDFVLPFSVFVSNGAVNYKFHVTSHWPYFLTGVAVIIDNKEQLRYVPFRGLGIGVE